MAYCKAIMHPIPFRPRWGSLQRSLRLPGWILVSQLLRCNCFMMRLRSSIGGGGATRTPQLQLHFRTVETVSIRPIESCQECGRKRLQRVWMSADTESSGSTLCRSCCIQSSAVQLQSSSALSSVLSRLPSGQVRIHLCKR